MGVCAREIRDEDEDEDAEIGKIWVLYAMRRWKLIRFSGGPAMLSVIGWTFELRFVSVHWHVGVGHCHVHS